MKKSNLSVYLINLDHANQRRKKSIYQLDKFDINPIIIHAYNGHQTNFPFHQYRHLSRGKWWDKNTFKPGAFACYLSHAKCWEQIAIGKEPYALILEDDMIINDKAFQKFITQNIPSNFDILFINSSISLLLDLTSFDEIQKSDHFVPFNKILMNLLIHNKFNDSLTPGGYGYMVSKKGAIKLLQMMKKDRICMGVDYAIIFNSLNNKDIEKIKKLPYIPNYLQVYLNNLHDDTLNSNSKRVELSSYIYALSPPISYHHGESDIRHDVVSDFSVFNMDQNFFNSMKLFMKATTKKLKSKIRKR